MRGAQIKIEEIGLSKHIPICHSTIDMARLSSLYVLLI
jgi:hypothetical protein